jgi:endonuclease/exonuclease/phosphatase family metal-dependent hydrolase
MNHQYTRLVVLFLTAVSLTCFFLSSNSAANSGGHNVEQYLTVMTWNVWFGADFFKERMARIIDIVLEKDPDVANFQEVLGPFHKMMREHEELMKRYELSEPGNSYFVATLTKRSLHAKLTVVNLPSSMGRELIISSFKKGAESVAVGNIHLESLNNHPLRELQLFESRKALAAYGTSVLVGDFNFCSERNFVPDSTPLENDSLHSHLAGYIDVWPALHQQAGIHRMPDTAAPAAVADADSPAALARAARGYTFDSDVNGNLAEKRRREVARYDRVMLRSDKGTVLPRSIELLGNEMVPGVPQEEHLFPSDHFGLLARFAIRDSRVIRF